MNDLTPSPEPFGDRERGQEDSSEIRNEIGRLKRDLELLESPDTICTFGDAAVDGDDGEPDYAAAANWYRIAAGMGSSRAAHNLAVMYEDGTGVAINLIEAISWYEKAAALGHPGSQNNLGRLYETGAGLPKNELLALEWYQRAAEGGGLNAQSNYASLKARLRIG